MFIKSQTTKEANKLSNFWMIDKIDVSKFDSLLVDGTIEGYMNLASLRRSIANFVYIVTGKEIPVEFIPEHFDIAGMTDGKRVFISAQIDSGDLDSNVGLALHEGSHILLTDFKLMSPETLLAAIPKELKTVSEKKGATPKIMGYVLKHLLNWIEDRRIDYYLYKEAPGYQGYYDALYDRYFHADIISKGLQSSEMRTEDLNSYDYRIANLLNDASDLNALKGLNEINDIINIKEIGRLRDTADALAVAIEVAKIIFKYIDDIDTPQMEKQIDEENGEQSDEENEGEGDGDGEGESDGDDGDDKKDNNASKDGKKKKRKFKIGKPSDKSGEKLEDLTKEEIKDLIKQIQKQKDFLSGKIKKVRLSGEDLEKIQQLANAGTEIKKIKLSPPDENVVRVYDSVFNLKEYDVVVIKKVSCDMIKSGVFSFLNSDESRDVKTFNMNRDAVESGIVLGKQLGRKLQIRNEERLTKYTRKNTGKIDKRLLAELGFGNESVFQHTFVEQYANAILHISLDISGSMLGTKLANAIKVVTAVCIAASMTTGNLHVVVDVRSTEGDRDDPFVAIVYDSRVDNIAKIRQLFPYLQTSGVTPEGLCFAAIQELIDGSSSTLYSYFLNLSDGEPYFTGYSGVLAAEHTRGEVNKMRSRGVNVLSYFIGSSFSEHDNFNIMYGKSAAYINPSNLMDIARTLNQLFLSKD